MADADRFLADLCRRGIGPLAGALLVWLDATVPADSTLLFLSREGHALAGIRDRLVQRGVLPPRPVAYLPASRAFLNRASLADTGALDVIAAHPFQGGSECAYLTGRLALARCPLCAAGCHDPAARLDGQDRARARRLLLLARAALAEETARARTAYRALVGSVAGPGTRLTATDLGYTGTIPALLGRLTGRAVTASFLVLAGSADAGRPVMTATARPSGGLRLRGLFGPYPWGGGEALLDRSLAMEAVLTAPFGQLVDVTLDAAGDPVPAYGTPAASAAHLAALAPMHAWVEEGAEAAMAAFGDRILTAPALLAMRHAYAAFTTHTLWPHEAADLLSVEDLMSGRPSARIPVSAHSRPDADGRRAAGRPWAAAGAPA